MGQSFAIQQPFGGGRNCTNRIYVRKPPGNQASKLEADCGHVRECWDERRLGAEVRGESEVLSGS